MVSKTNVMGLLAALTGIYIFKATTFIPAIENQVQQHPFIVIGAALLIFFYRERIAVKLGAK